MATSAETDTIEALINNNFPLLSKRLQVGKLIPYFIQEGLLDFPEDKQVIMSKTTTRGKAEALLELLSEKGTCTTKMFVDILKKGDHKHVAEQLKWVRAREDTTTEGPQVFISHAGQDKERFVRPLVEQLQLEGFSERLFYDEISLRHGDDFDAKIRATLSSPSLKLVVFVISRHVLTDRYWPKLEWELTLQANKKVFPIWLDQNDDGFTAFGEKVRKYSPTLKKTVARKVLANNARGEIPDVAEKIMRMLETA